MARAEAAGVNVRLAGLNYGSTHVLTKAEARTLAAALAEIAGSTPDINRYRVTRKGKVTQLDPVADDFTDDAHDWIGPKFGQAFVWATGTDDALARANALRAAGSANKAALAASLG